MDVILDIDGTVADCDHRRHLVEKPSPKPDGWAPDWPRFFDLMHRDAPIMPVIEVARALWLAGHKIVATTGRPASHRSITEDWFGTYGVPHEVMYMRATGDTRPDEVVKAEMLERMRRDGYNPALAIDDRSKVVAFWRSQGIICLQAAPGDF